MLIGKRCVGVGLPDDPNRVCAIFLVKTDVIARPVRKLAVAIRVPRPQAPLPKGGWHGEAVTGGFFSCTPGRARGPCPTKTVVGADASVRPSALGTIAAA